MNDVYSSPSMSLQAADASPARAAQSSAPWRSAIVVGAGVVGVATAYALARRGVQVTIVDRESEPACGTSYANGAQLSYVYTDALANPGILRRAPGLLLGLDPAFRLKTSLDMDSIRWLLGFLRNASASRFRKNTLAGLRLGLESRLAMHRLLEIHPLEFSHMASGKLHIYDDAKALKAMREMVALKCANGAVQQQLTQAEAIRIEPALAARSRGFAGAIHSPQEEVGDPHRFCRELLNVLVCQYGARARLNTEIQAVASRSQGSAVLTKDGERLAADGIVICAGIDSRGFLAAHGLRGIMTPMKGYSFSAPLSSASPRVSITDVARKLVMCPLNGGIRVAGRAELGAGSVAVDATILDQVISTARQIMPQAADYARANAGWAGLRSMTPSSLPLIRWLRPGVAVNIGHGMLGWTFAMGSAERLAALALPEHKE